MKSLRLFILFLLLEPILDGQIRAELERGGIAIGSMDMLIVSQAISLGLILVTNNVRELSQIPGLTLDNWAE